MKKSTKGALAAGAAAVLLLGGAGSLAYWSAEGTASGGTITAGSMSLALACPTPTVWKHVEDDSTVSTIVPGDEIYEVCPGNLTLVGDHIAATVALDASAPASATATDTSSVGAAATLDKETTITAGLVAADGSTPVTSVTSSGAVNVRIDVKFPYTTATNDSMYDVATLNDITVTATQQHLLTPTPAP